MYNFRKIILNEIKVYKRLYSEGTLEKIKITENSKDFPALMRVAFLSFSYVKDLHNEGKHLFSGLYRHAGAESKKPTGILLDLEIRSYIYLAKEAARDRKGDFIENVGKFSVISELGIKAIENALNYDVIFCKGSASLAGAIIRREKREFMDFFIKHEQIIDAF
jgi:hypothetical protein